MAERTYTVTVASGNLYPSGTGNVYFLDGARNSTGPGTVSWVAGGTLRFDQSAASNDGHPLVFSTSTSTSGIISSGVTYYLDGASNQAGYTNTTTFNAATTRYVEITPSSQTDFYYLCYVHGSGMGGIMDMTSSTWGALDWGQGSWAAQGDAGVSVTGIQAQTQITQVTADPEVNSGYGRGGWDEGSWGIAGDVLAQGQQLQSQITAVVVDNEINIGWGGDTWGENAWGELSGVYQDVTGQSLTPTTGSLTPKGDCNITLGSVSLASSIGQGVYGVSFTFAATGLSLSTSVGDDTIGIGVNITGSQLQTTPGGVTIDESLLTGIGWGRRAWGNLAWGEAFSAVATGQSLTSSIGNETVTTDFSIQETGQAMSMTLAGNFSIQIDNNVFVNATEDQLDLSLGNFTLKQTNEEFVTGQAATTAIGSVIGGVKTPVDVTGIALTSSLGTIQLVQTTVESVTGVAATMSLGDEGEIPGQTVGVTGQALTSAIGTVTNTGNATVSPTGISLTSSVGAPNITAWAEIDPGVNNVWSPVDLAA